MQSIRNLSKNWSKNPAHSIVHWLVFMAVVIVSMDILVATITMSALETQGIESHASTTRALLNSNL
jgi:hypothetical protein